MVASNHDLMFVWQARQEESESLEFFAARHPCEISCLDEDISRRQVLNLEILVLIMRIGYGNDSYNPTFLLK
jgi:hypothetical protein